MKNVLFIISSIFVTFINVNECKSYCSNGRVIVYHCGAAVVNGQPVDNCNCSVVHCNRSCGSFLANNTVCWCDNFSPVGGGGSDPQKIVDIFEKPKFSISFNEDFSVKLVDNTTNSKYLLLSDEELSSFYSENIGLGFSINLDEDNNTIQIDVQSTNVSDTMQDLEIVSSKTFSFELSDYNIDNNPSETIDIVHLQINSSIVSLDFNHIESANLTLEIWNVITSEQMINQEVSENTSYSYSNFDPGIYTAVLFNNNTKISTRKLIVQ